MISKKRLLEGLNEIIYVEEGILTTLVSYSSAIVSKDLEFDKEKKKSMKKILDKIYSDSTRHKKILQRLIKKVENTDKNVF